MGLQIINSTMLGKPKMLFGKLFVVQLFNEMHFWNSWSLWNKKNATNERIQNNDSEEMNFPFLALPQIVQNALFVAVHFHRKGRHIFSI